MKRKHTLVGIIFTSLLGTLSHFLYECTGYNTIIGTVTPVNESIWEHLKLLFFPVVLFSVYEYFARGKKKCFIPARTFSLFAGMFFIVSTYYTISGIVGKNIDWLNITIFFISVIVVFILTEVLIKNCNSPSSVCIIICMLLILTTSILFIIWSFYPPNLNIFIDRLTKMRGIYRI